VPLRRVVLNVAGARVDLHALVDDVVEHLRAPHLHHRALDVVLLDALEAGIRVANVDVREVAVNHAGRAVDQRL
jgi:hypothetical protein